MAVARFIHYFTAVSLLMVILLETSWAEPLEDGLSVSEASVPDVTVLKQAENIDLKEVVAPIESMVASELLGVEIKEPLMPVDERPVSVPIKIVGGESETVVDPPLPAVESLPVQAPLVLLGSEVPAGTSTRLSWSPNVSFMGISAPTAVLVVHGAKPGPRLCLVAATHGDELNGIEVVRHILYSIEAEDLAGTVIGVPIVNLQGFRRSSRYLPDRRDLNRYFPGNANGSSASRIAHSFFQDVVRHCDMLVDLHTGSFHRTNLPQLRANLRLPEVADLAKKMGAVVAVHSEGAPGCLRRAAVDYGIPAITFEAGQPHQLQKSAVNHGVKSVESLLDGLEMLNRRPFWEFKTEPAYYQSRWVRVTSGGILFSEVLLGDSVREGQLLGVITDPITNHRQEVVSPFAGRVIGMALNQVMYPGFAAYHLGLESSIEWVEGGTPPLLDAVDSPASEGDDSEVKPLFELEEDSAGESVLEDS
ncbi:succinylglutamate desuccinylase/aspartoacylase family protein [Teredinibacter purpureus]|uniref:succinylglutamate desuccinylase/aspartoacylase family protein n=1 Tax=Teredinibacter purpureus TaxID=2731756 RepID=UPI0006991FC3|nr:succinylglutamate desuccinylase/aspartoacylase family protein [Teredinibacter purpureus]